MYNPQLPRWLDRITVPTLLVWGASDGIVTPDYGRAYGRLISRSRFVLIEGAGHHPEIEQPEAFVERVGAFLKEWAGEDRCRPGTIARTSIPSLRRNSSP